MVARQLTHAIKALETKVVGVITETTRVVDNIHLQLLDSNQVETEEKGLKKKNTRKGEDLRFCSHFLNVDASTRVFHTERDCSYILISVPLQENSESKRYDFQYKVNSKFQIGICMVPGVSFTYSAYLLTHRQHRYDGNNFFSIAAYANAKLYSSAKQSIIRNIKTKTTLQLTSK